MSSLSMIIAVIIICFQVFVYSHEKQIRDSASVSLAAAPMHTSPDIFYISFVENNLHPRSNMYISNELFAVHHADDYPFSKIALPWNFNYFGSVVNNVYASPNGAIHISPYEACVHCHCYLTTPGVEYPCTFDNAYHGVIAGYLNDLFPGKFPDADNVTVTFESDRVVVYYDHVPFFANKLNNTFQITLFEDSAITFDWISIQMGPGSTPWQVGLRAPLDDSHIVFTSQQLSTGLNIWKTSVPGIYPSSQQVVSSGNSFTMCPVSTAWCASPAYLNISKPIITVRPFSISCLDRIEIVGIVSVGSPIEIPDSGITKTSINFGICNSAQPAPHQSNGTFECNFDTVSSVYLKPSSVITIQFAWRVMGSTGNYSSFALVSPLNLTVVEAQAVEQTPSCVINSIIDSSSCGNNACAVCAGNYSCLDLTCDAPTHPVLYKYPVCNNTCYEAKSDADWYFDSDNNVCCKEESVDCSGVCYGLSIFALDKHGHSVCCPSATYVDCMGICGGDTNLDACGVCGGTDFTGKTCSTGISVRTNTEEPNILNGNIYISNSFIGLAFINVTNMNSSDINATLSLASTSISDKFAPTITIDHPTSITIVRNSSYLFPVKISLTSLVLNPKISWIIKEVDLNIILMDSGRHLRYSISVYPVVYNCSVYDSDADTCMRLPGCITCFDFSGIRMLEEESRSFNGNIDGFDHEEDGKYSTSFVTELDKEKLLVSISKTKDFINNQRRKDKFQSRNIIENSIVATSQRDYHRSLYPNIIPDVLLSADDVVTGLCRQGWDNIDCPELYDTSLNGAGVKSKGYRFISVVVIIILMNLFLNE